MAENGPSNALGEGPNGGTSGPKDAHVPGAETRYEVGPGFEIAIRAALNRPVEVTVKKDGEPARPPSRSGDLDHRHESIEKRLEGIERALFLVVDQLKRIEEDLTRVANRPV